jgi:limonene-1,2-epoxide hydrolase
VAVIDAVGRRDHAALRALLHPYLHWTDPGGATVRGRRKVLACLSCRESLAPPVAYEVRDGQVYRWREGP